MRIFEYPATLAPDQEAGGFVVTFRDFPEAITQGENVQDALSQAADALDEAVANRMALNLELPTPREPDANEYEIPVPAPTAIQVCSAATGVSRRKKKDAEVDQV